MLFIQLEHLHAFKLFVSFCRLLDLRKFRLGAQHLTQLKELRLLSLSGTQISDASIPILQQLTKLKELHLNHTGMTPAGKQLNSKYMPWPVLGQMTDEELTALWLSLKAMPGRELGNR